MRNSADGTRDLRGLWLAVALYAVVVALKVAAFALTGVMAVFAEALHTLSQASERVTLAPATGVADAAPPTAAPEATAAAIDRQ